MANKNPSPATRFQPGREATGGRPKGSRDALSKAFIADLTKVYEEHGLSVLEHVAKNDQPTFAKLMFALLPKEIEIKTPESDLSDADIEALYQEMLARMRKPEEHMALTVHFPPGQLKVN